MKRILLLSLILLFTIPFISAFDLNVESVTDSAIVFSFSNLQSLDVKFTEVTATAETPSASDIYVVDTSLSSTSDKVLLSVDVSPLKADYSDINSILVNGYIESNGVQEKFSKRIAIRSEYSSIRNLAPEMDNATLIYWTTGIAVLFVILIILFLFVKKPQEIKIVKPIRKRKRTKKKVIKKKAKKKRL